MVVTGALVARKRHQRSGNSSSSEMHRHSATVASTSVVTGQPRQLPAGESRTADGTCEPCPRRSTEICSNSCSNGRHGELRPEPLTWVLMAAIGQRHIGTTKSVRGMRRLRRGSSKVSHHPCQAPRGARYSDRCCVRSQRSASDRHHLVVPSIAWCSANWVGSTNVSATGPGDEPNHRLPVGAHLRLQIGGLMTQLATVRRMVPGGSQHRAYAVLLASACKRGTLLRAAVQDDPAGSRATAFRRRPTASRQIASSTQPDPVFGRWSVTPRPANPRNPQPAPDARQHGGIPAAPPDRCATALVTSLPRTA